MHQNPSEIMACTTTLQARCTVQPATKARLNVPPRCFMAVATTATDLSLSKAASAPRTMMLSARPRGKGKVRTRSSSVASMWRQVQGCDDWAGLLHPLHPVVRDEVARYGEQVGACYAALDMDPSSARYMCSNHAAKSTRLKQQGGYEVTRYIYATPSTGKGCSSCVGYVAVSTDEMTRRLGRRDVLVAFRGTVTRAEWAANLMSSLAPARLHPCDREVKVESGFLNLYTSAGVMGSCRDQLLREVSRLVNGKKHGKENMSVTLAGHSMGSALAMLLGYDLAELGLLSRAGVRTTVFTFGGPRVGNAAFKARCDELGVKALRVANVRDPVTMLPGAFLNERAALLLGGDDCYTHVGVELALDFLRLRDPGSVHDLATYVASLQKVETESNNDALAQGRGLLAAPCPY